MPKEIERARIRALLDDWEEGRLNEGEVHHRAEALWEDCGGQVYPDDDSRSIGVEILSQLEILNHQWITREDIPAIRAFLNTPPGEELTGWREWRQYWSRIDWEARRAELLDNHYYSASSRVQ